MTIRDCYDNIGADFDEVKRRLMKESLIEKFALKFLKDDSFEELVANYEDGSYGEAFRNAHTLKGVAQNLGFKELYEDAAALTELLRGGEPKDGAREWLEKVKVSYKKTTDAIREYQSSQ